MNKWWSVITNQWPSWNWICDISGCYRPRFQSLRSGADLKVDQRWPWSPLFRQLDHAYLAQFWVTLAFVFHLSYARPLVFTNPVSNHRDNGCILFCLGQLWAYSKVVPPFINPVCVRYSKNNVNCEVSTSIYRPKRIWSPSNLIF